MTDNVHRLPAPDVQLIDLAFALFGNAMRGKIELAWTEAVEPFRLRNAQLFDLDAWDDLVSRASRLNAHPNTNVYFSLGLRREDAPHKRADDEDVVAVVGLKADFDRQGAAEKARELLAEAGLTPSFWVYTGEQPYLRAHAYWLLEEPSDQMARVEQIERWIAQALRADTAITNRSRIMRLPGSVAWPLKAGRVVEMTGWLGGEEWPTRAVPYSLDEIESCVRRAGWAKEPETNVVPFTGEGVLDLNDAPEQRRSWEQHLAAASEPGQWHVNVLAGVAQMLAEGLPPRAVYATVPLIVTQPGYTLAQTRDEVRVMIEGALAKGFYRPPARDFEAQAPEAPEAPQSAPKGPPGLATAHFDGELPPPRPWAYGTLLMRKALTVMASPPGVGKTTFSLQLAVRFAMGIPWLGMQPIRTGPVVVINGEEPLDELKRRFLAACIEAQVDPARAAPLVKLVSGFERPIKLVRQDRQAGPVKDRENVRLVHEAIRAHEARLAILDPLVDLHGADEKDNAAMAEFMQVMREMAGLHDMAVMAFSHVPKAAISQTSAGDLSAIRGGGAIGGAARIAYTLYPMTKEEADRLGLSPKQAADYVRLDNAKASMTRRDTDIVWLRKEGVSLDNAADGYPADEVGVLCEVDVDEEFQTGKPSAKNHLQRAIYDLLEAAFREPPMLASHIAKRLGKDLSNVSKTLKQMEIDRTVVKTEDGRYRVPVVVDNSIDCNEIDA